MKASNVMLYKYEADEGKVFDWKEPRFIEGENGEQIQEHLYAKALFIGPTDTIENYVEVDEAGNATELATPEIATNVDYEAALAELGV